MTVGTDLAYSRAGRGEPLVLLHGLGCRREFWDPVTGRLADRCDVVALDLRGHGESALGDSAAFGAQVDAVASFCADLGLDRPHLAGNSMGGGIALELGRRGLARSVTAFSPIGFWRVPGRVWCQVSLTVERSVAARLLPHLAQILRPAAARVVLTGLAFGKPTSVELPALIANLEGFVRASGFGQARDSFTGHRFDDPGRLVEIPTTVAWGTRDILLTYPTQHRRARAALPSARHVRLPGCGHIPFSDDPPLCAQTILDTVDRAS